jgi:hypothetical protein
MSEVLTVGAIIFVGIVAFVAGVYSGRIVERLQPEEPCDAD